MAHRQQRDSTTDTLMPTHHLVYFPNVQATNLLLPDGTDSWQSPGPPFTRRMWAGGNMFFLRDIPMNGHSFHCVETIETVTPMGREEREKLFVRVKRSVFAGRYPGELARRRSEGAKDELSTNAYLIEGRVLAFMRDDNPDAARTMSQAPSRVLKPKWKPHFSHTMVPTRELLFRFSALTYNAHAIHLDRAYCREVEGHRNLLVQGPLTVMLMMEVLRTHIRNCADSGSLSPGKENDPKEPQKVVAVDYKNLRPLYVDEEMRICVRRVRASDSDGITPWDVWIEGADGGYAVRGRVKTVDASSKDLRPARSDFEFYHEEGSADDETIPMEHVALQHEANANFEKHADGDASAERNTD